ncbi:DUF1279 super [Teratosphaeriaceae sp. CCFEE 6253]|nr:DUF1279 super [Teratosphaeriaceae sp. CCFEE 6253]
MLTTPRTSSALLRNVLHPPFTQPASLRSPRNFPLRQLTASRLLSSTPSGLPRHSPFTPLRWRIPRAVRARGTRSNASSAPRQPPSPHELAGQPPPKQESKFKQLSRKYGWVALGVYLGLTALDFPFCFLAVRWLGTERIFAAEEWLLDGFWTAAEKAAPGSRESCNIWLTHLKERYREWRGLEKASADGAVDEAAIEAVEGAQQAPRHHEASLGTQLALAYALHKSLIFFRLPLAASITPGVAKWLRKRGWNVGKPAKK